MCPPSLPFLPVNSPIPHSPLTWLSTPQEQSCCMVPSISLCRTACHPSPAGRHLYSGPLVFLSLLMQLESKAHSLNTFLLVNCNFLASFPCALCRPLNPYPWKMRPCFSAPTSRWLSGAGKKNNDFPTDPCPYSMISGLSHEFIMVRTNLCFPDSSLHFTNPIHAPCQSKTPPLALHCQQSLHLPVQQELMLTEYLPSTRP